VLSTFIGPRIVHGASGLEGIRGRSTRPLCGKGGGHSHPEYWIWRHTQSVARQGSVKVIRREKKPGSFSFEDAPIIVRGFDLKSEAAEAAALEKTDGGGTQKKPLD
jgi:hypothetical protein